MEVQVLFRANEVLASLGFSINHLSNDVAAFDIARSSDKRLGLSERSTRQDLQRFAQESRVALGGSFY